MRSPPRSGGSGDKAGVGSTVKMVNQLLAGVHIATAAEALALGIRAGADPRTLFEVISSSAGSSWMWQNRVPHILDGDDTPLSAVNIFVKDLGIVLDQARALTFPLPMAVRGASVVPRRRRAWRGREGRCVRHPRVAGAGRDRAAVKPVERLDYQASIDRPRLALPDGKRVAVFIVVNVENWDIARAMPRQVLTAPQGASVMPDLPNWAWHEYGMRVGFWRLKAALDAHGIAPSMTINGTVPAAYPRVTQAARDAGWEFMGHGFRQIATHLVEDQRAMIRDAIAALREAAGHDIVGWLAPGLTETLETPDLLAEAGIRYCADWVVDDLPCTLRTAHGPLLTMPYSVELNDIPMMMIQHHAARELFDRTVAQFDRLYAEAETQGAKVMGLAVHPYISGVPHRIGWFEQALGYMAAKPGTLFWQGRQIMDWYLKATA